MPEYASSTPPGGSSSGPAGTLLGAIRGLGLTMVELLHTRAELLATEIEDEYLYLVELLVIAQAALFCAAAAVAMLSALVIAAYWNTNRLLAIGLLAGTYAIAAALIWWHAIRRYRARPRLLSASLGELARDRDSLAAKQSLQP